MTFFLKMAQTVRLLFYAGILLAGFSFISLMCLVFYISKDLPKLPQPLSRIIETPQTQIYAASGQLLINLGERKSVPLNMISPEFINAILAIEDHRFFEHRGINKLRTFKGLYITLFKPGEVQGASTITQQLAKNMFFSFEKSYTRKFKELLIAFQIEATCTKEEILHAYVNQIHFGAGAQGVEKAARVFFGKSAMNLSLDEAALLAGLPKSPTGYNPYRHYDKALERRDVVLNRMAAAGFITPQQAHDTSLIRPALHSDYADSRTGSYFLDALINELIEKYGQEVVYHGGIKVTATIDMKLQSLAQEAVQTGLEALDQLMGIPKDEVLKPQAALVAVDTASGAIRAMIGGRNYYESEFNRAIHSRRQPGSGFKPFIYYQAFKQLGFHPGSVITDKPVRISIKGAPDWEPENFSRKYSGRMILKNALTHSINTVSAQLIERTGPEKVIQTARACGIISPLENVYSLALGTCLVTPLEMASAFSTFANLGIRHDPFLIWRVEDPLGRVIYEHIVQEKQVLEPSIAYQIVDMMQSVIDRGSGQSIRKSGFKRTAAGKTGTTDNYNDAWFTGFTPALCTSVWTGFDKPKRLIDTNGAGITGGRSAGPIWAHFMENALKGNPERQFSIPDDIRFEVADIVTGCPSETSQADDASIPPDLSMIVPLKSDQLLCADKKEIP